MEQIPARPAATIVVIREQNEALEILMLRRSSRAVAATGAYVFPGGGVDDADVEVVTRGLVEGLDEVTAARRLAVVQGALQYYCAALRELFEEAGILIAVDVDGHPPRLSAERSREWRRELGAGRVSWADLLEREGLRLALDDVHYLAHWVTPVNRPRRFDTRFFVSTAPSGQSALADGAEVTAHVWTTASDALRRFESAQWEMLVPTVRTLTALEPLRTRGDVVRHVASLRVTRTQPREIRRDGRVVVVVPGEEGYESDG